MVAKAVSKISLPLDLGAVRSAPVQVLPVVVVEVRNLTDAERKEAVNSVEELHNRYFVGMSKLARAVGRSTDLKTILLKQRKVPYDFVVQIASAVGLTPEEFMCLPALSVERTRQLEDEVRERGLFESRRPLINTRLKVFTNRNSSF